jgi:hypothetical protein
MKASDVFDSLFPEVCNDFKSMPQKLADFIDSLFAHAKTRGVDTQQLFDSLRKRQFGIEMSRSSSGFDSTTQMPIEAFVNINPYLQIKPQFIDSGTRELRSAEPLMAMMTFINKPNMGSMFGQHAHNLVRFDRSLDESDEERAKRIDRVGVVINSSIKFNNTNNTGRLSIFNDDKKKFSSDGSVHLLAKKLINMQSKENHGLSRAELEGLGNPGGYSRGKFIYWLVKIVADAVRGNADEAISVGIKGYGDFLTVINNMNLLSNN